MFKDFKTLFCILVGVALASCSCPRDRIHATGACRFRITCFGAIEGIDLPDYCLEASNYPVNVFVVLYEARETFGNTIENRFLNTITSLKISAKWTETSLAILEYTNNLQTLHLEGIGLHKILGSPFQYLNHLENLDLSHNKLTDIKELFQFEIYPNKLQNLSLAFNAIEDIPGFAFEELSSLTELDLSHNIISDLTEEPFYNLTSLRVLRLNNNRIKDLNGAVNKLCNLLHLYVRGNQIQNIDDESLEIIEHLETFDVSLNELEEISPIMFLRHWNHFNNHTFCKIYLSENHISHIPNGTAIEISSRFTRNLDPQTVDIQTELDLSMNSITSIEHSAFHTLIRLVSLNLFNNKIIDFSVNGYDLAYVQYLNLSNNYISYLNYESFALMNNLQNLDLSYNRLDFIPDATFYNSYNLRNVNMTFNDFERLDRINIKMFHPEGGVLDLSNNGLFRLKVPRAEGLHLFTLVLRSNNISDSSLIDLRHQTDLKNLDMSNNLIRSIDVSSLHLPVNLEVLDLSFNQIKRIGPSAFHALENVKIIRLANNYLTQLEYGAFKGLQSLQNLDLSFNRIGFLDSTLLTDLKALQILSVRSNYMNLLDYKGWYGHNNELQVFVDNNNLTCEWLVRALNDLHNGYSKMRPVVLMSDQAQNSVEGIPCLAEESASLTDQYVLADDRLLLTSKKILLAVREQNNYLKYLLNFIVQNADKSKKTE